MLVGFFVGAFIGAFAGGWFALLGGCLGAMLALAGKSERVLTPDEARERRRAKSKANKAKARKIAGGSALASTATASQWHNNDAMSDDALFSCLKSDSSISKINPATGLPMLDSAIDVGGNVFGSSSDDWDSNSHDSFSDSGFNDDSSFSSFDDW